MSEAREIIESIFNTHPRSQSALIKALEQAIDAYAEKKVREERERISCLAQRIAMGHDCSALCHGSIMSGGSEERIYCQARIANEIELELLPSPVEGGKEKT